MSSVPVQLGCTTESELPIGAEFPSYFVETLVTFIADFSRSLLAAFLL
jgi:hypothetical protein